MRTDTCVDMCMSCRSLQLADVLLSPVLSLFIAIISHQHADLRAQRRGGRTSEHSGVAGCATMSTTCDALPLMGG